MPAQLPAVQQGQTLVSVCAFIENGGGSALLGLTLTSSRGTSPTTLGIGSFPPGPCRTYLVRGAFALDDAAARSIANHPGDLVAIFGFQDVDDRTANEMRGTLGLIAPPDSDRILSPVGETCVVDVVQRAVVGGV
ncbi:MAG: hypothetical protein ABIZ36_08660 [Gemmatimonadaceae bacterium]